LPKTNIGAFGISKVVEYAFALIVFSFLGH